MVIIAATLDPATKRPTTKDGFNAVAPTTLNDLFVLGDASKMPGASLQPYPRRAGKADAFGVNRWSAGINSATELHEIFDLLADTVDSARKWALKQVWFGKDLNSKVTTEHWTEVNNFKALAKVVGFENLISPCAQNETVDIIVMIDEVQVKTSVKTASQNSKYGFQFELGAAPNSDFCDIVMVFYKNGKGTRTHVSVLCAREVYDVERKSNRDTFGWSPTLRPHVLETRISLRNAAEAAILIKQVVQIKMNKASV
jgi:hypothetical protein